jgi:hypothetical protein
MRKLSIFDDGEFVATITTIDSNVLIFARSSREWSEMQRLVHSGYIREDKDMTKINPQDSDFLEHVAARAHSYNFSTELINE